MSRHLRIFGVVVLVGLLILIRFFEARLFYDPLLLFFKVNYKTQPLPEMDVVKLHLFILLRYLLNSLLSLAILWLTFWKKEIMKISIYLYIVLFIPFFVAFFILIANSGEGGDHLLLFYVRRFLIHPLFLLILVPAFYFQKYKSR